MMQGLVTELIARVALGHGVPALNREREAALRRSFHENIFSVDAPSIHLRSSGRSKGKLKPQPVYDLLSALTGALSASGRATDAEALRQLVDVLVHDVGVDAAADVLAVLSALEQPAPPRDDSQSFWMPCASSIEATADDADPALALLFQLAAPRGVDDSATRVGLRGVVSGLASAGLSLSDFPVIAPADPPDTQRPRPAATFEQVLLDDDAAGLAWDGGSPNGSTASSALFGGLLGADAIGLFAAGPAIDESPQRVLPRTETGGADIDASEAASGMSAPGHRSAATDLPTLPPAIEPRHPPAASAEGATDATVVAGASPARRPGIAPLASSKEAGSSLLLLPDGALLPEAVLRAFSLHVLRAAAGLPSLTFPLEGGRATTAGTAMGLPTSPAPAERDRLCPTARLLFDASVLHTAAAARPFLQLAATRSVGCCPSSAQQTPTASLLAARCSAVGPSVAEMGSRLRCLEAAAAAWAAGTATSAGSTPASPRFVLPAGCTDGRALDAGDPAGRVGTALQSYLRDHVAVMLAAHMHLEQGAVAPAAERGCSPTGHSSAASLSPLRLWLELEPWCARLADLQSMLGLAGWEDAHATEGGVGGSDVLQRLYHSLSRYQLSDPPDGAWEGVRDTLGAHATADSAVAALRLPSPPSRLALASFLFGVGVGPLLRGIRHAAYVSHSSASPAACVPTVHRPAGPSATLHALLPLLADAASSGLSHRSDAVAWLQLQGSASHAMDLLRAHVPAAFSQLVQASGSTGHTHGQHVSAPALDSEKWPTMDGEYWASAAQARAVASQQVESLVDWCTRTLRDREPASTATSCEEEEVALRTALLRHLIPTLRSAAVAAFGPPAEPDEQPLRSSRPHLASEDEAAAGAHDDSLSSRPGLAEAAAASAAVGSLRQRGASSAAAAVREARRQQSAAQEQAREMHAAARRDEHSRLLLQAQEAAAARVAAKAARKAAEALEAREIADLSSPRRIDGSVIPMYSHRYASPAQGGQVASSAVAESADLSGTSASGDSSATATGQADEAPGGSLVSHARIFLLQEYGQRLAHLAGGDGSALHADGQLAAAAMDGSVAADAGRVAELLALDALGSLGPAGVRVASETAAALGLPWSGDRLQRLADPAATVAAGPAASTALEGSQDAAAAPVAAAEAPAAGVPTVRAVSLLAALPSTRDRQQLFRSAARGQLGDVLFGSLPELAPLLPPVFLTHVRVSQPPGGHASAVGQQGSPASRRRLRAAVPGRSADMGEAEGSSRGTTAFFPAPSPGARQHASNVFGADPESPAGPSKRRLPTPGGHAPLNLFSSAAARILGANESPTPDHPADAGSTADTPGEPSAHAAAGIRSSSSSSSASTEGAGEGRRHIRVAQPSGGVSDMGSLLFPDSSTQASTATASADYGAASAVQGTSSSAEASEGGGAGDGGTARPSPRPQASPHSDRPRSSVQVSQPSGGLSSIGDLLFPRAAEAPPAGNPYSAEPPSSRAGDEGRHASARRDGTQGPGSPSAAASQQSGGGASTVQGLLYPDADGLPPAAATGDNGRSPHAERSGAAPGASASPAAAALTHVVVSQPPGGHSSMRSLIERSEASGAVFGRGSSGGDADDGSVAGWASEGGRPDERFKPSVRVRQPVGGASTVQYLLGAGSKPARQPARAMSGSLPHGQQLDTTGGHDVESAPVDSADDRLALLGLLTGRDAGELRMLPLGASGVMSVGPPGGSDGICWPQQMAACRACALTVPVAHVTRTLVAAPLRCSLLLARAYGAVALLLHHDLLRHYAALRAWMLCGEGRVLTEVAEALLSHIHAREKGPQHPLPAAQVPGGSPSAGSGGVEAEAKASSPALARERAAPTPADVAAAANAALARMQADLGFSDRWGDYREQVLVRVQEALAVQNADPEGATLASGDGGGRDASLRAHGHLLARACGSARSSAVAALSNSTSRRTDGYWGSAVGGEAVQALHAVLASVRGQQGLPSAVEHMHRFWYEEAPLVRLGAAGKPSAAGRVPASAVEALLPRYSADAHPLAAAPGEGHRDAGLAADAARADPGRGSSNPLFRVLTPACMARYGRVHVFMLRLRVCALAVQKLWVQLMQVEGSGRRSSVSVGPSHPIRTPAASLRPLYLFRHEASLLVRAIEEHCMRQLQHECYGFLLHRTATAGSSVEALAAIHDASTQMMLARCMLPEHAQADLAPGQGASAGSPHDSLLRAGAARLQSLLGMVMDACEEARQAVEASAGTGEAPAFAAGFDASQPLRQLRQGVAVLVTGLRHLVASGGVQAAHLQELLAQLEALRPTGPVARGS